MSEQINHECGIALVRLLKPLEFYVAKYGTALYGIQKLHLMLQKQHNRGQDGAGIAEVKFDLPPGNKYISRLRSNANAPIQDLFNKVYNRIEEGVKDNKNRLHDVNWLKANVEFTGELFLGHLRYGTFGGNSKSNLHPMVRANNWKTRSLVLAGNFNMTNNNELFETLVELGQYPVETSDTVTVLEKIGHFLDEENERLYMEYKNEGFTKVETTQLIIKNIDVLKVLTESAKRWDGGYVIGGLLGHGDSFVMRDPSGIRPAYYYADDEIVIAASERPVIQTTLNLGYEQVKELEPGTAMVIKKDGQISFNNFIDPLPKKACSFERIYFSRGTDQDIYIERKKLGWLLGKTILEEINYNFRDTVFSFIPNTASVAFQGLADFLNEYNSTKVKETLLGSSEKLSNDEVSQLLSVRPRIEAIAVKDVKLRTFITAENQRDDLVAHIYDITYGLVKDNTDTLVVLDDSIVRGTTLRQSIIRMLDRLNPKKIVIVSSAPQIRYPDCYGIDMARLNDFVAFKAAIELLKETQQEHIINEVYSKSKAQQNLPKEEIVNHVKDIYKPFSAEQISDKIAELVTAHDINAVVKVIYQSIENLHSAIPNHTGDWYFTGNYPTPGGNKVVNQSFINYIEGRNARAY